MTSRFKPQPINMGRVGSGGYSVAGQSSPSSSPTIPIPERPGSAGNLGPNMRVKQPPRRFTSVDDTAPVPVLGSPQFLVPSPPVVNPQLSKARRRSFLGSLRGSESRSTISYSAMAIYFGGLCLVVYGMFFLTSQLFHGTNPNQRTAWQREFDGKFILLLSNMFQMFRNETTDRAAKGIY